MYKVDLYTNQGGLYLAYALGNTPKDAIDEMYLFLRQQNHHYPLQDYEMRLVNSDGFVVTQFWSDVPA